MLDKEISSILQWEDKLKASRYSVRILEDQLMKMSSLKGAPEYEEFKELIFNARLALASAYTALAIKKAKVGLVGRELYTKKK